MRNLRLRQWLLLLLRTLIILLIVLAFARPTLQNSGGSLLAERGLIEAVIIVDNSLSLNESRLTGTLLENLRESMLALQDVFQAGDRITVLQSTIPLQTLAKQEIYQSGLWDRLLQKIQPNYLKSDLTGALTAAVQQLGQSVYATKEIYVISDFQKTAFVNRIPQALLKNAAERNLKVFAIPILHEHSENISVDSMEIVNRLIEKNQPLRLKVLLRNHHPEKFLNTLVSVILNGNRVAQQNVSLAAGQVKEVPFELTLLENGFVSGLVETESDALPEDNRRYFNFYVPEQIKILHIHPTGEFHSFLPLILQPAQKRGIFQLKEVTTADWSTHPFRDFNVVVTEGLDDFPETLTQRLAQFAEQGGGVVIIPGEQAVTPRYQALFQRLNLGKMGDRRGEPGNNRHFLTLQEMEWKHPIFEGLFKDTQTRLNPIEVYAGYRMHPGSKTVPVIQLSDRSPFLLQSAVHQGTAFLLTSPLQLSWTQLPIKGFVVPLLYRIIYYAGTRKIVDRQQVRTGEVLREHFTNLQAPFNFVLKKPGGAEVKIQPRFQGANVFLEFSDTYFPGNYHVYKNDHLLSVFSVNSWKEESQMAANSGDDLEKMFPGIVMITDNASIVGNVQQTRFGKELWKHFLIAAFILLLVEMAIARTGSRKEFATMEAKEIISEP